MPSVANIREKESVVYWSNMAGELMLAPDTLMKPFRGWMRHEAKTAAEIEAFSRRFARQEFDKFRSMKIEEHLRSKAKREALRANCELRLAKGCISKIDEQITRQTLKSLEIKDQMLYKLLTDEPDLSRGSLMIERYEQPKVEAMTQKKRRGLSDDEVNLVGKLAETTA